ncbi:hypothetical protein PA905_42040 [Planktothrix agardhii CCAP 1459/11A]|uniref:Uncharacterized protein n=1 Tax=Planktothrix agardhii CCAP 1459/11A TaxID=282420 RepID=A0A4P5ZKW5_PLAAG|nr:hypothetical protein PA905_42040 [Planktothrix agardhii CCAP 1459/11A]
MVPNCATTGGYWQLDRDRFLGIAVIGTQGGETG